MRNLTKLFFGSVVGGAGYLLWQHRRNVLRAIAPTDELEGAAQPSVDSGITDIEPEPRSQSSDERVVADLRDQLLAQADKNVP